MQVELPEMAHVDVAQIYWIGGSPCSGKSSVAEALSARHHLRLAKADDYLETHMRQADAQRQPVMHRLAGLSWNENFTRPVETQVQDELVFYREEFPLLLEEFARLPHDLPLLVEGAALLPEFFVETQDIASPPPGLEPGRPTETQNFASLRVVHGCVVYLIPTRPFQLQHYAQRPWVLNILSQCDYP